MNDTPLTAADSKARQAIARALFAARIAGFEDEIEGDLYRMAGNFREAYAGVDAFREELTFHGFALAILDAASKPGLDELVKRLIAEYDEDNRRPPSFVTIGLLREALRES